MCDSRAVKRIKLSVARREESLFIARAHRCWLLGRVPGLKKGRPGAQAKPTSVREVVKRREVAGHRPGRAALHQIIICGARALENRRRDDRKANEGTCENREKRGSGGEINSRRCRVGGVNGREGRVTCFSAFN